MRRQTENGANCRLFGSANKASCSGRTKRLQLSFSAPFLCFFLWTNKERKKDLCEQKMNIKSWTDKERKILTLSYRSKGELHCLSCEQNYNSFTTSQPHNRTTAQLHNFSTALTLLTILSGSSILSGSPRSLYRKMRGFAIIALTMLSRYYVPQNAGLRHNCLPPSARLPAGD